MTDIDDLLKPMTPTQKVRFAIYCAETVTPRDEFPEWHEWAARWLSGTNRSIRAAVTSALASQEVEAPAAVSASESAVCTKWAMVMDYELPLVTESAQAAARAAEYALKAMPDLDLDALAAKAIRDEQ